MTNDVWQNRIVGEDLVAAGELVAHPQNWRKHPKEQGKQLAAGLGKVGWVQRVIVNKRTGRMLDGHLRAELARTQGEATPVPVVYVDLSEDEERTVLATLDPIAGMAIADEATLAGLVRSIEDADLRSIAGSMAQTLNVDVDGTGEAGRDTEAQVDRAEELRQKWGVEPGQLWQLGEHRLICGDCTDAAVVARVMAGDSANMVIADPPYGVNIVAANGYVGGGEGPNGMIPFGGKKAKRGYVGGGEGYRLRHGHYAIEESQKNKRLGAIGGAKPFGSKNVRGSIGAAHVVDVGKYMPIVGDETTDTAIRSVRFYLEAYPKAAHFWWGANYYSEVLAPTPCWVVWDKETTGNFADCELAWSNVERAARVFRHRWNGMLRDSERERRLHPTQKPAALAAFLMTEFGKEGDIVIDPFAGAGWAVIGGENTGRRVRAIEMVPEYIAVICERWATHTGKVPVLVQGTPSGGNGDAVKAGAGA